MPASFQHGQVRDPIPPGGSAGGIRASADGTRGHPASFGRKAAVLLIVLGFGFPAFAQKRKSIATATIEPADLVEYETEVPEVRKLIEVSLELTKKRLGYQFGSNSPDNWGMDCSGTVQAALSRYGMKELPRSSYDFYEWAKASGTLVPTPEVATTEDPIFAKLKPGDLLFWEGTYETGDRDPPISHVMIYLGTLKADGEGVVFGASSGRRYRGKKIHGVSVFDWEVPREGSDSSFVGYGPIPGLRPKEAPAPPIGANVLKSLLENLVKKSEVSSP